MNDSQDKAATTYTGGRYAIADWTRHVDALRADGTLSVGEWRGYIVPHGESFGPHHGPFYVLIPWRRDGNLIAVAHEDPDEAVALASRLEVEL